MPTYKLSAAALGLLVTTTIVPIDSDQPKNLPPGLGLADVLAAELEKFSDPVRKGPLEFRISCPPVWLDPGAGGVTAFRLNSHVTNCGTERVLFLPILGKPVIRDAAGTIVPSKFEGRDRTRGLPKIITLKPGEATTITELIQLRSDGNERALGWQDERGGYWSARGVNTGPYSVAVEYKYAGKQEAWTGPIQTQFLPIKIRELTPSKPVAKDELECVALVEPSWPVPAPGKQSRVDLGLRVKNLKEKDWVRVTPYIEEVQLRTADGKDIVAKRMESIQRQETPIVQQMEPGRSRTVNMPSLLLNDGETLTLSWLDFHGNAWRADGLRAGMYEIRFVVKGHEKIHFGSDDLVSGKRTTPSPDRGFWTRRITTEPIKLKIGTQ